MLDVEIVCQHTFGLEVYVTVCDVYVMCVCVCVCSVCFRSQGRGSCRDAEDFLQTGESKR